MSIVPGDGPIKQRTSVVAETLDVVLRVVLFTAFWWMLNDGDVESWVLGAPIVALATLLSVVVVVPTRWRVDPYGFLIFLTYFVRESLLSSIDVAARVSRPAMPLKPGVLRYRPRLPTNGARVVMANMTSLLPGTLCVGFDDDEIVIHALDTNANTVRTLRRLEERIAGAAGFCLTEERG